MKTSIQSHRGRQYKLVIDEPGVERNEKAVLAVMELYEGLGVWTLTDLRLAQHHKAGPWFNIGADEYHARYAAPDENYVKFAHSLLRETNDSSDPLVVSWCTFNGIVRGKTPEEMGLSSRFLNTIPRLHTRKEGLDRLEAMKQFWLESGLNETDPDVREKASAIKIDNPWRQPSQYELSWDVMEKLGPIVLAKQVALDLTGFFTPSPKPPSFF
jgi:hypothetical protein